MCLLCAYLHIVITAAPGRFDRPAGRVRAGGSEPPAANREPPPPASVRVEYPSWRSSYEGLEEPEEAASRMRLPCRAFHEETQHRSASAAVAAPPRLPVRRAHALVCVDADALYVTTERTDD